MANKQRWNIEISIIFATVVIEFRLNVVLVHIILTRNSYTVTNNKEYAINDF